MLHEFPAEAPLTAQGKAKKPADLAGFVSESSAAPPKAPEKLPVRRSNWRRAAVAGLCAGTGLAVAVGLWGPTDYRADRVPVRSHILVAPEPSPTPEPAAGTPASMAATAPAASVGKPDLPDRPSAVSDESLVRSALERYRGTYERLDVDASKMIWPIHFDTCRIDVDGARSVASCQGDTPYVARAGEPSRGPQTITWTFALRKDDDEWKIDSVQQSR